MMAVLSGTSQLSLPSPHEAGGTTHPGPEIAHASPILSLGISIPGGIFSHKNLLYILWSTKQGESIYKSKKKQWWYTTKSGWIHKNLRRWPTNALCIILLGHMPSKIEDPGTRSWCIRRIDWCDGMSGSNNNDLKHSPSILLRLRTLLSFRKFSWNETYPWRTGTTERLKARMIRFLL